MDRQLFENEMYRAQSFRRYGLTTESLLEYWNGYIRGLRRAFFGYGFGDFEVHACHMAAINSSNNNRRMYGLGYRDGLKALNSPELEPEERK